MNVLSLFDGISCGQIALERAGIPIDKYYASEIDKYAIQIAQKNYPNTIQLGDICRYNEWNLPQIDILIGGSPCQGFSFAGKQLNFKDERSRLFFEYVKCLKRFNPKYFLLENVNMKQEYQDVISEYLGVKPIRINSKLISAQNRDRLYWTNIPNISQPQDRNITWGDIKQIGIAKDSSFYYSDKALDWIKRHSERTGKRLKVFTDKDKMQMLEASMYKKYSSQRFFGIDDIHGLRYITLIECERCQTLPDNYTYGISNTQRYKSLGNGWTVDVISHILNYINNTENLDQKTA